MKKVSKEDNKSIIRVAFYSFLGLGLSILFFYLDYKLNNTFIRVITCIVSVLFMSFVLYRFHKKDNIFDCLDLDRDVDKLIIAKFTLI